MIYAILSVIVIITTWLLIKYYNKFIHLRNSSQRDLIKLQTMYYNTKSKLLEESLYKALATIDSTHAIFNDEDEANREITTCLNIMGHNAVYHKELDNGRIADVLVDGFSIIEGKLDPKVSDIDRLVGQIGDYLTTLLPIYIVIYGTISESLLWRINEQIILKHPSKVSLVYLHKPTRTRTSAGRNGFNSEPIEVK